MEKVFDFIDLFAGIGGFHLALHDLGANCVYASEKDTFARKTYEHNFKKIAPKVFSQDCFNNDILKIVPVELPDFDILCAGFPCQPFSQAGQKKGFDEKQHSRGNMFFIIRNIIKEKRPSAIFLENVRHLIKHDDGKTFKTIRNIIEEELNYTLHFQVVKASDCGIPQLRPRLFMVGFRKEDKFKGEFSFPSPVPLKFNMSDVWDGKCSREVGFTLRVGGRSSGLNDRRNWDSYLVDGKEVRLGVKQGKMMQGIPDEFEFPVSKTQALKQLGNGVAVDAIRATAKNIISHLNTREKLYLK